MKDTIELLAFVGWKPARRLLGAHSDDDTCSWNPCKECDNRPLPVKVFIESWLHLTRNLSERQVLGIVLKISRACSTADDRGCDGCRYWGHEHDTGCPGRILDTAYAFNVNPGRKTLRAWLLASDEIEAPPAWIPLPEDRYGTRHGRILHGATEFLIPSALRALICEATMDLTKGKQ